MTGYGFFRSLRLMLFLVVFVLMGLALCVVCPINELNREAGFRHRYGDGWQAEYEKSFGPLSDARIKIFVAILGFITILSLAIWLVKVLRAKPYGSRPGGKPRRHRHGSSTVERIVRYRRNALVGVYFGVGAIVAGVALVVVRWGIFAEHSSESTLGFVVFLCGYCGVVSGCWWWLKAKAWTEAVVFIAFMPLVVFLIPFVRYIFAANPAVIMVAMVMAPLILVVVVLVLPDKSGFNQRRTSRNWPAKIDDR